MSQIETIMSSKAAMIALAIVAFLVAALLVLIIVRMLFGGKLRMAGGRARQARLGIVDAFDLDRQRQLIIVRRDNTEHLIMIGGPNDILIESEIVRVEARDTREGRRDKDGVAAPVDGRIPAPIAAERGELRPLEVPQRPANEPMLPMPPPVQPQVSPPSIEPVAGNRAAAQSIESAGVSIPDPAVAANGQVEPAAPRVPTFPLPPRRPPPPPERRPAPPPRLPDSVSRADDRQTSSTEPSAAPLAPPASAPPRTAPPFLKPLPPRPPVRPLQRSTPQPPVPPSTPVIEAPAAPPPVIAPAPPSPRPQPAPEPQKPAESNDALESLEEEMAKLLGRGPG